MRPLPKQAKHFVCSWLIPIASLVVASYSMLSAQTLLNARTLSGSGSDTPAAIATDSQGNVYLTGSTNSPDFPLTHGLFAQLLEPALRFSTDGRTFASASLSVPEVDNAAASSDGHLVLAGTPNALYRSADGGATWGASASPAGQILAVAVNPLDSTNAWAVAITNTYSGTPASPAINSVWTIYKSTDSGVTWKSSAAYTTQSSNNGSSQILINPQNPSIVYAFIYGAVVQSTDAGAHWQTLNNFTGFAIAPSQPNIVYATSFTFPMQKSVDGGATWQPAAAIGSAGQYGIAVDPQNASVVWLVGGAGIQKSTNGAASFQKVAAMGDGSWQAIAVSNTNSSQVFAADRHNVYATFDGGSTWTTVASGAITGIFTTASGIYVTATVSPTVFLTKLDPTLTNILYSTLIGPGTVSRMLVDAAGNVYLAGTTQSHSYPTTPGVLGTGFLATTAGFVTKVRADGGALLYSTVLDNLWPTGLAIDSAGNAVIVGSAVGTVPVTANAVQPSLPGRCTRTSQDSLDSPVQTYTHAYAAKLSADGSAWIYATWLTGACGDAASDVVVDSTGAAWVGGTTFSTDFAITPDALTAQFPTSTEAGFVTHLSADGSRILYSTFVGAGFDANVDALALDSQGNIFVAGGGQLQATPGAYQNSHSTCPPVFGFFSTFSLAQDDVFVLKLSAGASAPVFLATIGGACQDSVNHIALDSSGNIWLAGSTQSSDFPTATPLPVLGPATLGYAGFLTALDPSGATLLSSSITISAGQVGAGPGGAVEFSEPAPAANKTGTAVLAARVDGNQRPAIALDSIRSFSSPALLGSPYYAPFVIAPGQVVRLIGRGIGPATQADAASAPGHVLPNIAGVGVTFNGTAAELISVQANQLLCLAPFELDGVASANVQVNYNGLLSNLYSIGVVPQNIDIIAVANPDGSVNLQSNPVAVNGVVTIYLTGLGQTVPPSVDGAVNTSPMVVPRQVPRITVNGIPEVPVFFGAAVGQVAGIMQVNLFVPDPGASASDAVSIGPSFLRVWTPPHL
jgi:uncharacterized protein (TIGR03437 family)